MSRPLLVLAVALVASGALAGVASVVLSGAGAGPADLQSTRSQTAPDPNGATPPRAALPDVTTWDYLPGVEADLHLPARSGTDGVPLVVMVPGGGWQTADRTGLGQLAVALAERGIAVTNATYRIGDELSRFPVPATDVRCAVDAGVAAVEDHGHRVRQVVLLGHSAGAHLSSLAAFGGEEFRSPSCPHPASGIDGWIGLSGFYDLTAAGSLADAMMGASSADDPEAFRSASTSAYLHPTAPEDGSEQHLDVLVVHGGADELGITVDYATAFAEEVRRAGHATELVIIDGADHNATWQAPVVADTVVSWVLRVQA